MADQFQDHLKASRAVSFASGVEKSEDRMYVLIINRGKENKHDGRKTWKNERGAWRNGKLKNYQIFDEEKEVEEKKKVQEKIKKKNLIIDQEEIENEFYDNEKDEVKQEEELKEKQQQQKLKMELQKQQKQIQMEIESEKKENQIEIKQRGNNEPW